MVFSMHTRFTDIWLDSRQKTWSKAGEQRDFHRTYATSDQTGTTNHNSTTIATATTATTTIEGFNPTTLLVLIDEQEQLNNKRANWSVEIPPGLTKPLFADRFALERDVHKWASENHFALTDTGLRTINTRPWMASLVARSIRSGFAATGLVGGSPVVIYAKSSTAKRAPDSSFELILQTKCEWGGLWGAIVISSEHVGHNHRPIPSSTEYIVVLALMRRPS